MSRYYDMHVKITSYDPDRKKRIVAACAREWSFDTEDFSETPPEHCANGNELMARAEASLCGGESEEEFSDRLAAAVWKANGAYCEVTVGATCLEELPYEEHVRDKECYKKWRRKHDDAASRVGNRR